MVNGHTAADHVGGGRTGGRRESDAARRGACRWLRHGACRGALVVAAALLVTPPAPAAAQGAVRSSLSGVYTDEQARLGREVFQGNCLGCHTVASHTGTAFALRWVGKPLATMYDYISSMMPKVAPGSLTEDEYVWVIAYILKLNGMPPGKEPLTAEVALLRSVRVDTVAGPGVRPGVERRR